MTLTIKGSSNINAYVHRLICNQKTGAPISTFNIFLKITTHKDELSGQIICINYSILRIRPPLDKVKKTPAGYRANDRVIGISNILKIDVLDLTHLPKLAADWKTPAPCVVEITYSKWKKYPDPFPSLKRGSSLAMQTIKMIGQLKHVDKRCSYGNNQHGFFPLRFYFNIKPITKSTHKTHPWQCFALNEIHLTQILYAPHLGIDMNKKISTILNPTLPPVLIAIILKYFCFNRYKPLPQSWEKFLFAQANV